MRVLILFTFLVILHLDLRLIYTFGYIYIHPILMGYYCLYFYSIFINFS